MESSAAEFVAPPSPRVAPGRSTALVAGIVAALFVLAGCGTDAGSTTFRPSAVATPTPDAFTPSVGTDQVGVDPPAHVTGAYPATTPGLYGGGGSAAACDPAALPGYLATDPAKAEAWAGVLGIRSTDLAAYVARLTSVVLRADTALTNHGFTNGAVTNVPSVLQAGTAVLVDDRGLPVVQCASGNPLTPAATDDAIFEGAVWDGFRPESVTTVVPETVPVADFVLADPTGNGVVRPIGTTGAVDTAYVPADDPPAPAPAPPDTDTAYPGAVAPDPDPDYPLGTPEVTTTYVATYQPAGVGDPATASMTDGCRRSGLLDEPFTMILRVRDGVRAAAVTVEGTGTNDGSVALGSPQPSAAVTDPVGPTGTFSAGGRRTYGTSTREGVLNARWSGRLGRSLPRPAEFPLTIRQTWARDPDFVAWLNSSGGPEDFSCAYDVVAARQA